MVLCMIHHQGKRVKTTKERQKNLPKRIPKTKSRCYNIKAFSSLPGNLNKYVFKHFLNSLMSVQLRRYIGSLFQSFGPNTEKAFFPCEVAARGTCSRELLLLGLKEMRSWRYCGAALIRHLKTRSKILKTIRLSIFSQCNFIRSSSKWSCLYFPVMHFDAAFCMSCNCCRSFDLAPIYNALQ